MSTEPPGERRDDKPSERGGKGRRAKASRPSRKLSYRSRVRTRIRELTDQLLGLDVLWSTVLVVISVTLIGAQRCGSDIGDLEVGQVAQRNVRAARDADILDVERTDELRREARESEPVVYVLDEGRSALLERQLGDLFLLGRNTLTNVAELKGADATIEARNRLADDFDADVLEVLLARKFDVAIERELKRALGKVMSGRMIVGNKRLLEREPRITVSRVPNGTRQTLDDYGSIIEVADARRAVRERLRLPLKREERATLETFVASFIDSNLNLDAEATERLREERARSVAPVVERVAEGTLLVSKGDIVTPEVLQRIEEVQRGAQKVPTTQYFLGLLLISSMTAFFLFRYTRYHQRRFRRVRQLHALLVLVMTSMLTLSWAILWVARLVTDTLGPPYDLLDNYTYLMPLGAGSIVVMLLANGRIAMVYAGFCALLFGAMHGWDPHLMVWAALVQCAGVYAIASDHARSALFRAGLIVGGAGAITALAMETLKGELEPLSYSMYAASLALVGGAVGVSLLISFALPLLEQLFNVLTDIRLLELSSSNHPLLAQLAVKAPGTYNHSLVVGNLAEEGARAIGANALFCKVAAAYHDVGKMNKPEYYVENQTHGNPHDNLSPSMSSLIIASHVKDGIKLAREEGLPEQIIDIIPQHHGTRLMSYFYERAKSQMDPSMGALKDEDFRYPGPKPQTREAAIFMIADGVEAAARTIDEPTANRLNDMIQKVTDAIVLDRQLDECDLTFADLTRIQEALLKRLVSMYHHRVDYPGFDFGNRDEEEASPEDEEPAGDEPLEESRVARGR